MGWGKKIKQNYDHAAAKTQQNYKHAEHTVKDEANRAKNREKETGSYLSSGGKPVTVKRVSNATAVNASHLGSDIKEAGEKLKTRNASQS